MTACHWLVFCTPAFSLELTPQECEYISSFDNNSKNRTFVDQVSYMLHTFEKCENGLECEVPLRKRSKDYSLAFNSDSLFHLDSGERIDLIANSNMIYLKAFLEVTTELSVNVDTAKYTPDAIVVTVLNEESTKKIQRNNSVADLNALDFFLEQSHIPCVAVHYDWQSIGYEYSEVFIRNSASERQLANCIKEEIYGAYGVPGDPIGEPSLFHNNDTLETGISPPIYDTLSQRKYLIMKLTYANEMKSGQNRKRTQEISESIIQQSCE